MDAPDALSSVRSRGINRTVGGILGLVIVIALAIAPLTLTIIHSRQSDALVVDLAGRQRMLLERHLKEVLLASERADVRYQRTRSALKDRVQALIHGGTAMIDDHERTVSVPAASTPEIRTKLLEQQRLMEALFAKADAFLGTGGAGAPNSMALDDLLIDNAALLNLSNEIVVLLTAHSEENVRTLVRWELAVVLLVMAVASLGLWRVLRAEQAVKRSQALTLQALQQRDAVKSALLSSVSHELRTPLTAIKTMLFTLRHDEELLPPSVRQEFLTGIDRELTYLNGLVGNLLDMSRLDAGTLTPRREWHVLDELVEGALQRVEMSLPGRELSVSLARELPPLSVDGMQIQQVLVNLLDNAIKFSPPGSTIRLTAALLGDELELRVSNVGEGVPPDELDRIFDRFYRVQSGRSSNSPGTGLGLAICKGIVEAHGGSIHAESVPGRDTTFVVRLPLAASAPPGAPTGTVPAALSRRT